MIATTSVPAIWALSGLGLSMAMVAIYMLIIFMMLAAILWPALFLAKRLKRMIFDISKWHD